MVPKVYLNDMDKLSTKLKGGFLKSGYPKSSILVGFSMFFNINIINHPAIGVPPFYETSK